MSEKEARGATGLSRARLVSEALSLVQDDGLEALSMRGLADRLNVKAASLYWHVRDRRELLELLAEAILDLVAAPRAKQWREAVLGISAALQAAVAAQRDAGRILLEVPEAIKKSDTFRRLAGRLESAGLQSGEAEEVALMVMVHVISQRNGGDERAMPEVGATASVAVDYGSRGVVLRHGSDMDTLIRTPRDPASASPAVVRGETVKVRRPRGVGHGEPSVAVSNPGPDLEHRDRCRWARCARDQARQRRREGGGLSAQASWCGADHRVRRCGGGDPAPAAGGRGQGRHKCRRGRDQARRVLSRGHRGPSMGEPGRIGFHRSVRAADQRRRGAGEP